MEDVDKILDESEREDSSNTDSLNEQPSSGQTAGTSSLTSQTDSCKVIEENVLFDNISCQLALLRLMDVLFSELAARATARPNLKRGGA